MVLKIRPYHKNIFPIGGLLIKGSSVAIWIKEIQLLQLSLKSIQIYPIPDTTANSIWGCLVMGVSKLDSRQIGINELCQQVSDNFFIPEKSIIYPSITLDEIEGIFPCTKHVIHPEFGLVELTAELNLGEVILVPTEQSCRVVKPKESVFIPKQIKSFQIKPVSPEDVLKNLEENIFPKMERMKTDPLSIFEKGKLLFYKMLFTQTKSEGYNSSLATGKTNFWAKVESIINTIAKKERKWINNLQQDFENLSQRNQKELDKLMDLLKSNPEEALKYAIPLDNQGSTRGGTNGQFNLSKRWIDFSLFGNNFGSGSGSVNIGDHFFELQKQYLSTAQELIKQKQYQKAAFVYMKLLKNHQMAAQTLESGDYFQEAATIYLKHVVNKSKAAECYEKGNMISDAIEIYKELNENEKVGDLYLQIHNRKEADVYFEKVVDGYKSKNQYVKASLIYKNKMMNELGGQTLLLEGWRNNKDAYNCLNNYFSNIKDIKILKNEIDSIYANDVTGHNRESFLQVIRHEYNKKNELSDSIKEMAYEIVAAQIPINPSIVTELKGFNAKDKELIKDILRFKVNKENKQLI